MTTKSESLAVAFPKQQARVRELLMAYKELGTAGTLGAAIIEQILQKADKAAAGGDVVEMIYSYQELEKCE